MMHTQTIARWLRRELYAILALEAVERAIGVAALVAIAVHAAVVSQDRRTTTVITMVVILALAHLALAFRLRAGGNLLHRDLLIAEIAFVDREDDAQQPRWGDGNPYRSAPAAATRPGTLRSRRAHVSSVVLLADALVLAALTAAGLATLSCSRS
jgi:hypothetical protein